MRQSFVTFFAIVLSLYGLINAYIFARGWRAVPSRPAWRVLYAVLFAFFLSAFLLGRYLEHSGPSSLSAFLIWVGSFWLAAMLYFVLVCIVIDFARLANHFVPFFPSAVTADPRRARTVALGISVLLVALIVLGGHVNALLLRTRTLRLDIPKAVPGPKTLNIVFASDIHLGSIVGASRLRTIVDRINALSPDVVILGGDIVDEDLTDVLKMNVGEALKDLRAPLGVYAVTGNHEYIGGIGPAVEYLTSHNVRMLRDEVIRIRGDVYLVGREDSSAPRHTGVERTPLADLMAGVDKRLPVIVLDHQPRNLEEAASLGADLEICGHTHNGQLWPWNLLVHAFYDLNYGYTRVGSMDVYVSSGAGTWGPPVRVGTHAEIVNVILTFVPPAAHED
jgi:hypothetical protein